jgi:dethiobiotin synthetase
MRVDKGYQPIWILGTDTNVGKTLVSAWLTLGLNATYWKPIQSGLIESSDTELVKQLTGFSQDRFLDEVYRFQAPFSPHLAARLQHEYIIPEHIQLPDNDHVETRYLLIEGAGGVLVPLNNDTLLADLVARTEAPVILVCRSALGTINHTLMTIRTLHDMKIPVLGFIISGELNPENEQAIVHFSGVSCLGRLPFIEQPETTVLSSNWDSSTETQIAQRIAAL